MCYITHAYLFVKKYKYIYIYIPVYDYWLITNVQYIKARFSRWYEKDNTSEENWSSVRASRKIMYILMYH